MSCNCNKNSSKPCGCKDSSYATPCGYTECSVGNERCDDVQCTECVSYCGTSFQIETAAGIFKIQSGERLDQILQKMALTIVNGLGACTADNVHHAPYNVYAQGIEANKATVVWNGASSLSASFNVQYDTVVTPSGWTTANLTPISVLESKFEITGLTTATDYKIKVQSLFGGVYCDSVEILITTL